MPLQPIIWFGRQAGWLRCPTLAVVAVRCLLICKFINKKVKGLFQEYCGLWELGGS